MPNTTLPYSTLHDSIDLAVVPLGTEPIIEARNVGFQATWVYINNYSQFWFWLRDAEMWIPPWWYGAVFPLYHTTDFAYVDLKSPYNLPQPATVQNFRLDLAWTNNPDAFYSRGNSLLGTDIIVGELVPGVVPTLSYTMAIDDTHVFDLVPSVAGLTSVLIENDGPDTVYIGHFGTVDATNGIPLLKSAYYVYDLDSISVGLFGARCALGKSANLRLFLSTVKTANA